MVRYCTFLHKNGSKDPTAHFLSNENQRTHIQVHHILVSILSINSTYSAQGRTLYNSATGTWPWSRPQSSRPSDGAREHRGTQSSLPRFHQERSRHHPLSELDPHRVAHPGHGLLSWRPLPCTMPVQHDCHSQSCRPPCLCPCPCPGTFHTSAMQATLHTHASNTAQALLGKVPLISQEKQGLKGQAIVGELPGGLRGGPAIMGVLPGVCMVGRPSSSWGNMGSPGREPASPELRDPSTSGAQLQEGHGRGADIKGDPGLGIAWG